MGPRNNGVRLLFQNFSIFRSTAYGGEKLTQLRRFLVRLSAGEEAADLLDYLLLLLQAEGGLEQQGADDNIGHQAVFFQVGEDKIYRRGEQGNREEGNGHAMEELNQRAAVIATPLQQGDNLAGPHYRVKGAWRLPEDQVKSQRQKQYIEDIRASYPFGGSWPLALFLMALMVEPVTARAIISPILVCPPT